LANKHNATRQELMKMDEIIARICSPAFKTVSSASPRD